MRLSDGGVAAALVAASSMVMVGGQLPTALPTSAPTILPTKKPTSSPSHMPSFTCSYPTSGVSNSQSATVAIAQCSQTAYLCPGDTITVGECGPAGTSLTTDRCVGRQYFVLESYPYGNDNTVAFDQECLYSTNTRNSLLSTCAVMTYTIPYGVQCMSYGIILGCVGTATCGGVNIPVTMPGPTAAPTASPTQAPFIKQKGISDAFGSGLLPGGPEAIVFAIVVGSLLASTAVFMLCLRFNAPFSRWFWSLEFMSKSFLGHQPLNSEKKQSNLEMWGYSDQEMSALRSGRMAAPQSSAWREMDANSEDAWETSSRTSTESGGFGFPAPSAPSN